MEARVDQTRPGGCRESRDVVGLKKTRLCVIRITLFRPRLGEHWETAWESLRSPNPPPKDGKHEARGSSSSWTAPSSSLPRTRTTPYPTRTAEANVLHCTPRQEPRDWKTLDGTVKLSTRTTSPCRSSLRPLSGLWSPSSRTRTPLRVCSSPALGTSTPPDRRTSSSWTTRLRWPTLNRTSST